MVNINGYHMIRIKFPPVQISIDSFVAVLDMSIYIVFLNEFSHYINSSSSLQFA